MASITSRKTLLLTTAIALALSPAFAQALPTGGSVSSGTATISITPTQTAVNQTTSKAIINWTSFNTSSGQTVQFTDPNSSAITLNRVSGGATIFDGTLKSNGNVWIINPNGLLIGSTGTVNTAGFLATASNITDSNFVAGTYNFSPGGGAANASITNSGNITVAQGGLAALVAPNVANSNIITANAGKIKLVSGDTYTLDLSGDGLINLAASSAMTSQSITNSGSLIAPGGTVQITAAQASNVLDNLINLDGVIEANSLTASNQSGDLEFGGEFNSAYPTAATTGTFDLSAYRNVTLDSSSSFKVNLARPDKLNVTLDSNDTTAAAGGAVYLGNGISINTNGGNIILGGGANPIYDYAVGDAVKGYTNGIYLAGSDSLLADGGVIKLNGKGAASAINSEGIVIDYQSGNNSLLSTSGTGYIAINGAGSDATGFSLGVSTSETNIQTPSGAITIAGTSGIAASEEGLSLSGTNITSSSGAITLSGKAAANTAATASTDYGTGLLLSTSNIQSTSGPISITGTTGAEGSTLGASISGEISSTSGNISISGTAGTAPYYSEGLQIAGSGMFTTGTAANAGNITIKGTDSGGNVSSANYGTYLTQFDTISTVGGNISVYGHNSTNSSQSEGVLLDDNASLNASGTGNISLSASGPVQSPQLVSLLGASFPGSSPSLYASSGDIALSADNINLSAFTARTPGTVTITPWIGSTGVGVAGGNGNLNIAGSVLQDIHAGSIIIGSTQDSGAMNVGSYNWNSNVTFLDGTGNITLTGITSTAANDSITLSTGNSFINTAGAGALAPGAGGRYLIYVGNSADVTLDGLSPNFTLMSGCSYGESCSSLPATGNGISYTQLVSE